MAVTLNRVLAGRLPFHDARGQPVAVVLAKHIYNEPTMLARAAAGADIAPAVASVIESALRKRPGDRPQTMLAFAEALRVAAASAAPAAPRRHRRLHVLLLALGLGVVATLLALALALPRPPTTGIASGQLQVPSPPETRRLDDMGPPMQDAVEAESTLIGTMEAAPAAAPQIPVTIEDTVPDRPPANGPQASTPAVPANKAIDTSSPRRRNPEAAWHRALALRTMDVQRCADKETGSLERLAVTVNIASDARVSAHVAGAADIPLSRCLDLALKHTPLTAPREPASIVHIFQLRTTPPRRP